jgi:hypothetical protein
MAGELNSNFVIIVGRGQFLTTWFSPRGELCPLGGVFTPRGEHSLLFRRMEGRTYVEFYPQVITSPRPLGTKFTPGGQLRPRGVKVLNQSKKESDCKGLQDWLLV